MNFGRLEGIFDCLLARAVRWALATPPRHASSSFSYLSAATDNSRTVVGPLVAPLGSHRGPSNIPRREFSRLRSRMHVHKHYPKHACAPFQKRVLEATCNMTVSLIFEFGRATRAGSHRPPRVHLYVDPELDMSQNQPTGSGSQGQGNPPSSHNVPSTSTTTGATVNSYCQKVLTDLFC